MPKPPVKTSVKPAVYLRHPYGLPLELDVQQRAARAAVAHSPKSIDFDANLTKLFKKDAPFVWGPEQEKSLQDLKTAFANSDFLTHPDDQGRLSWRPMHRIMPYPVYSAKLGVLHDDQEVNSSSGSLVFGIVRVRLLAYSSTLANLMVGPIHFPVVRTTSQTPSLLTSSESWILRSQVLEKVFVLESDWPLIIADFLAGEDNVWMDDVPEVILERCKRELKHFRFRDNSFLRILEDGKSTAAYVTTDKRVDVMKHYHTSLAHLKYGSIIDLLLRRFWWPSMKKDLKDFIARCPEFREQVFDYLHRLCNSMGLGQAGQGHDRVCRCRFPLRVNDDYGAPFEIISDRGKSFLAEGIDLFERENKIRHLATTPYHPQTNGMVERMHAMLGHGLTTLVHGKRDRWDEYLPQVLLALRTRTHAVTGFSPFFLCSEFILVSQLTRLLLETLWRLLTKSNGWRRTPNSLLGTWRKLGQARSAANVRTKAQSEAMRKRGGFR
ncbi:hypothetical protein BASA61_002336 [Batrachochytrium salamandrivorans]|nr:hypothetical protein BASA61_002336 [Batrachochytrium salamandrivorans]